MGTTANRNDLVCFEEGVCRLDDAGLARCLCSGASNRYGDFCQFEQGQLPVLTDEVDCAFCGTDGDRNKVCVDNACTCQDGFYLGGALGDTCLEAQLQEPPRTAESVGAVIGVLVLTIIVVVIIYWLMRQQYRKTPNRFKSIYKKERSDASIREEHAKKLENIQTEA